MEKGFKARRNVREWTHQVEAPAAEVFPLLCPVREYDWIPYWECDLIFSESGVAEDNCIFRTELRGYGEEIWTVSRYEPERCVIEFVVVSPASHVEKLDLHVEETGARSCAVHWTRTLTALNDEGNEAVEQQTGEVFDQRMTLIGEMLVHFVATGEMLRVAPAG